MKRFEFSISDQDYERHRAIASSLGISLASFYRLSASCFINQSGLVPKTQEVPNHVG
jgi:hypothetical protein